MMITIIRIVLIVILILLAILLAYLGIKHGSFIEFGLGIVVISCQVIQIWDLTQEVLL